MPPKHTGLNKGPNKPVSTVQSLLTAKVDKDKGQPNKRLYSEVSNDSNNSLDLSGIMNLQKDIDEIKSDLQNLTSKQDLDRVTKDLMRTSDMEQLVTSIVQKLLNEFRNELQQTIEKEIEEKVNEVKNDMQEKIEALSIENQDLKNKIRELHATITNIRRDLNETTRIAKQADVSSNYNEQYSRKNNIKIMNFPRKERQDLRKDFIETCKNDLRVELEDRDVVAIHRFPSKKPGPFPVIVKLFNSDVKRKIMRERKKLSGTVKFVDDVTQRNMNLIKRLNDTQEIDQVWYYNCGIYGRTNEGLQLKFGTYDDIQFRLQKGE